MSTPPPVGSVVVEKDRPRYSVCITHFNDAETVSQSLDSIVEQVDGRFEVIVVDQDSTDGSQLILQKYEASGAIKLLHQKVRNRGSGRQFAYLNATGEYVISNLDLDDVFLPFLSGFVTMYHTRFEGSVVRIKRSDGDYCGVTIFPYKVLDQIGGWRDLNWFEDVDVWNRCKEVAPFFEVSFPVFISRHMRSFSGIERARHSYLSFREGLKVGMKRKVTVWNWPLFVMAWIAVHAKL